MRLPFYKCLFLFPFAQQLLVLAAIKHGVLKSYGEKEYGAALFCCRSETFSKPHAAIRFIFDVV
jgi:hypothetical protein